MKILIVLLLSFVPIGLFSQYYRFIYECNFVSDTIKMEKHLTNYYLDISPKKVKFYDEKLYKLDSIQKATNDFNSSITISGSSITRSIGTNNNNSFIFIDQDYYQIKSKDQIKWKIENETKIENGYKLQKATTYFGKRFWIAWFNENIDFHEGPYKFRGLPGLIYEIEDDKGYFQFKLIEIKKQGKEYSTESFLENSFGRKPFYISQKKYNELLLNAYHNPFSEIRNRMQMGEDYTFAIYGMQIKTTKGLDEIKRMRQEEIKNNYNPIDLDNAIIYK